MFVAQLCKLTIRTKMAVCSAHVLTTHLYGSESWTLYSRQEKKKKRLDAFFMRSLRHILDITWSDRVLDTEVLTHVGNQSTFTLVMQPRLRWLGNVHRITDGKIPKDLATTQLRR